MLGCKKTFPSDAFSVLDLPSWECEPNKFLVFLTYPICGILLQQSIVQTDSVCVHCGRNPRSLSNQFSSSAPSPHTDKTITRSHRKSLSCTSVALSSVTSIIPLVSEEESALLWPGLYCCFLNEFLCLLCLIQMKHHLIILLLNASLDPSTNTADYSFQWYVEASRIAIKKINK